MKKITFLLIGLLGAILSTAQSRKILFVMSAANQLPLSNGKVYDDTGVFLSEFYITYKDLSNQGYTFEFATPDGRPAKIDQESFDEKYWRGRKELIFEATNFVSQNDQFTHPITLEAALNEVREYDGLIIPGGQGLMIDLIHNHLTKEIIAAFANQRKCIGLICHAPALLTTFSAEETPFKGYKVNSVTGAEEFFIEKFVMKGRPLNRKIGRQLKRAGYRYVKGRPAKNFAVRDRNLITSQNPFSNEAFSRLYLVALSEN